MRLRLKPRISLLLSPNFNQFRINREMTIAAASAAARSVFRSSSVRNATTRFASQAKSAPSPFRIRPGNPTAQRIFRCPAEMSACLESMQPFHNATASALMTSMLTVSRCGFGWLPEGI